jgi:hypothetical protein
VRRADPPTVLPSPKVIVVQGGIKSSGLAAVLSFFWCGLGQIESSPAFPVSPVQTRGYLYSNLTPDVLMMRLSQDWYRSDAANLLRPPKTWNARG